MGAGMGAWAKELKKEHPDLAQRLDQPRDAGWRALEELDLPRYKRTVVSATEFLQDPAKAITSIPSEKLFVFLQPADGKPVRKTKLSLPEAIAFVQETAGEHPERWEVHVSETEEEKYGGNISVNKDGGAVIELTTQGQGTISAGTGTPELRAWQDAFSGVWHYSSEDQTFRQLVQHIMRDVPHDGNAYLQGLYEFHVVQPDTDEPLETRFVDYRVY